MHEGLVAWIQEGCRAELRLKRCAGRILVSAANAWRSNQLRRRWRLQPHCFVRFACFGITGSLNLLLWLGLTDGPARSFKQVSSLRRRSVQGSRKGIPRYRYLRAAVRLGELQPPRGAEHCARLPLHLHLNVKHTPAPRLEFERWRLDRANGVLERRVQSNSDCVYQIIGASQVKGPRSSLLVTQRSNSVADHQAPMHGRNTRR
mmetsp:Transcript_45901/g.121722  ORF Transcript_45901/g.121722 Transcript_45901/m.121722 type:complete len:204 (-) Transcript_45901:31-642(-)